MNLLELKYVELSGKIVLLEEKNKEVIEKYKATLQQMNNEDNLIILKWTFLKAELKAIENQLNVTNQIEEVK